MKCPVCGYPESRVVDSRPVDEGSSIRRRRECLSCAHRFTTFEVTEALRIVVIKKDGSKELFDRSKLLGGLLKATQKRPVDAEQIAKEIGRIAMEKLRAADEVAYVRFASVYREFKDVDSFLAELKDLKKGMKKQKGKS